MTTMIPKGPKNHKILHKSMGSKFLQNFEDRKSLSDDATNKKRKEERSKLFMNNRSVDVISSRSEPNKVKQSGKKEFKNDFSKVPDSKLHSKHDVPIPSSSGTQVRAPRSNRAMNLRLELSRCDGNVDDNQRRVKQVMLKSQSATHTVKELIGTTIKKPKSMKNIVKHGPSIQDTPSVKIKHHPSVPLAPSNNKSVHKSKQVNLFLTPMTKLNGLQIEHESVNSDSRIKNSPKNSMESSNSVTVTPEKMDSEPNSKVKESAAIQFDEFMYLEYHESLAKIIMVLRNYSDKWNSILSIKNDIPEDIIGQISSTIGQAELLLDSKLPQFSVLLYHCLRRYHGTGLVLYCDLQGWWDAAVITVEKVKQLFENLAVLESNAWKNQEIQHGFNQKFVSAPVIKKLTSNLNKPLKLKPKATTELLTFLEQKRKNLNVTIVNVEENIAVEIKTPKREFNGGFFLVCTLIGKPSSSSQIRLSSSSSSVFRSSSTAITPFRRKSLVPRRMMAVRIAMGAIYKIGVHETWNACKIFVETITRLPKN